MFKLLGLRSGGRSNIGARKRASALRTLCSASATTVVAHTEPLGNGSTPCLSALPRLPFGNGSNCQVLVDERGVTLLSVVVGVVLRDLGPVLGSRSLEQFVDQPGAVEGSFDGLVREVPATLCPGGLASRESARAECSCSRDAPMSSAGLTAATRLLRRGSMLAGLAKRRSRSGVDRGSVLAAEGLRHL